MTTPIPHQHVRGVLEGPLDEEPVQQQVGGLLVGKHVPHAVARQDHHGALAALGQVGLRHIRRRCNAQIRKYVVRREELCHCGKFGSTVAAKVCCIL